MALSYTIYMIVWITACLAAAILLVSKRCRIELLTAQYARFLFTPWKLITFLIAVIGLAGVAPYTGDPSWDFFLSIGMGVLTFLTAPWALGTFYRFAKGWSGFSNLYIASCFTLFSASWFYDGYTLYKFGVYPDSWFNNLMISTALYLAAGFFWNLEPKVEGEGGLFAFQEMDWFNPAQKVDRRRLALFMTPFILFVSFSILWFVWTFIF